MFYGIHIGMWISEYNIEKQAPFFLFVLYADYNVSYFPHGWKEMSFN